jgi:hypothetical protein
MNRIISRVAVGEVARSVGRSSVAWVINQSFELCSGAAATAPH